MTVEVLPLPEEPLELGGWRIEPRRCRIARSGHEVRLEPRVMQTLVSLAARPGATLTRDELMLAVWGHPHLSEDALNRTISQLRKAFAHGPQPTVQIETVPRIGYRLVVAGEGDTPAVRGGRSADSTTPPQDPSPQPSPPAESAAGEPVPTAVRGRSWLRPSAIGAAATVALIAAAWWAWPVRAPDPAPDRSIRVRPLTAQAGHELSPSYSPDGSQVVYAGQVAPGDEDFDLYVLPIGTETPLRITEGPGKDYAPAWSPDGSRIAFRRYADNECAIFTVAPVGGPLRRVQDCDPKLDTQMSWSPDGRELALASQEKGGPMRLALLNVDAGSLRMLDAPPDNTYIGDSEPAFAPGGAELAFLRWRAPAVADLYVRNLTSGAVRRLTQDNVMMYGPAWTPDGQALVFSSARGGDVGLWQIASAGGEPRRVPASAGGRIEAVAVNPRGGQLVYQDWAIRSTLWSVDLAKGGAPSAVTRSTRWDWHPRVAPSAQELVFVSDRSGAAEVWVSRLDGSQARRLTSFNGPAMTRPSWAPDARSIAFDAAAQGNFDLYAIDLAGGAPRRLTDDPAEDRISKWSLDGRFVYFGSNRGGSWQVWKVAPGGGAPIQVTKDGGFLAQESNDGWLYFSRRNERGLWRRPLNGAGEAEQVVADTVHNDPFNWTVDGARVLFVEWNHSKSARLMEFDPSRTGERTRLLAELPEFAGWSGLAVLPEGRLMYSRAERNETDLILLDNADEFVPRRNGLAAQFLPPPGYDAGPSRVILTEP